MRAKAMHLCSLQNEDMHQTICIRALFSCNPKMNVLFQCAIVVATGM